MKIISVFQLSDGGTVVCHGGDVRAGDCDLWLRCTEAIAKDAMLCCIAAAPWDPARRAKCSSTSSSSRPLATPKIASTIRAAIGAILKVAEVLFYA